MAPVAKMTRTLGTSVCVAQGCDENCECARGVGDSWSVVWVVSRVSSGRVYRHSSETKEKGSKEMADRREERAIVHVAQLYVASSRPSHQCSDAWCLRAADPVDSA